MLLAEAARAIHNQDTKNLGASETRVQEVIIEIVEDEVDREDNPIVDEAKKEGENKERHK